MLIGIMLINRYKGQKHVILIFNCIGGLQVTIKQEKEKQVPFFFQQN